MPSKKVSRRHVLKASPVALIGSAGCLSETRSSKPSTASSPRPSTNRTTNTGTTEAGEETNLRSLSVADFILYPLASVHPYVHRRAHTQYVIVQLTTSQSAQTSREKLTLTLDDEPMPLTERQPIPWKHDTVDVAFAVSKTKTFDRGQILFDQTMLRTLSGTVINRLNNPPVFEISNHSVSPNEVRAGKRRSATVRFNLANTGESRGTFGASLKGNFVSGANTVTTTLDSGGQREVTASAEIVGKNDEATVRLDWGSGEWSAGIPVIGTSTTAGSSTHTSSAR